MGQVRQEIDRSVQEKEEEFDHSKKNHSRSLDSMQASLEAESKAKEEALRIKKKYEGLNKRKSNAMSGELEESNALLDAAIRGQRQVEQELIDTREQVTDINGSNTYLANGKRMLEKDIHQMQADLDNMLASCKNL